ncbi:hypothetical protein [Candidatus Tisiphia endosymbiont of Oplodontha viridula]|uniref:hypothetical protein n=1 Tax=Candidatus Tisiphia endosymbiont of Oplodontha viridula TaxID=3077925 RepID=UPI0035C8E285
MNYEGHQKSDIVFTNLSFGLKFLILIQNWLEYQKNAFLKQFCDSTSREKRA